MDLLAISITTAETITSSMLGNIFSCFSNGKMDQEPIERRSYARRRFCRFNTYQQLHNTGATQALVNRGRVISMKGLRSGRNKIMRDDTDHQWQWGPVTETDRICLLNHSDRDENQFRLSGQCQCVEDQIKSLDPWTMAAAS
jgi:hypothetical protein